ncbi:hypothetical protein BU26DRAFT_564532 [Trematosphaeria pertusa]|uniref:Uncharacterized protein n=1 Tax=Trematosphaeria pertusa TaxID=390896 RepID=A0A6A6IH42_9PLEO|nr:uncharacterized protein BU26DRAFT_564532 [Trematosphaeria pertusa]KAF2248843.1 hypothetical protein BU26DRAFT_564532 [Trematosphaeria pertusa]
MASLPQQTSFLGAISLLPTASSLSANSSTPLMTSIAPSSPLSTESTESTDSFVPYTTIITSIISRPPIAHKAANEPPTFIAAHADTLHAIGESDIPDGWQPKQFAAINHRWYAGLAIMIGLFVAGIVLVWCISWCQCWWAGDCFWNTSAEEWRRVGRKNKKTRRRRSSSGSRMEVEAEAEVDYVEDWVCRDG